MIPYTVSNVVTKADKLLTQMRGNPAGDWTISDVQLVCVRLGWTCMPPTGGGSHWKIAISGSDAILTIPAKRPIKPVYIRKLMEFAKGNDNGKE
jgi:hypothetical protein